MSFTKQFFLTSSYLIFSYQGIFHVLKLVVYKKKIFLYIHSRFFLFFMHFLHIFLNRKGFFMSFTKQFFLTSSYLIFSYQGIFHVLKLVVYKKKIFSYIHSRFFLFFFFFFFFKKKKKKKKKKKS